MVDLAPFQTTPHHSSSDVDITKHRVLRSLTNNALRQKLLHLPRHLHQTKPLPLHLRLPIAPPRICVPFAGALTIRRLALPALSAVALASRARLVTTPCWILLCARCAERLSSEAMNVKCMGEIETVRERLSEEHLIPLALARVERFDGGLSRGRWEAQRDAENAAPSRPLQHDTDEALRAPSPIYVNLHNPIENPTFKKSPTKPIPRWMRYLSSTRQEPDEPRPSSVLDTYFSPVDPNTANSDVETPGPPVPPHSIPFGVTPPVPPYTTSSQATIPTYVPVKMSRPFTFIAEEPVQRPSSGRGPLPASKHVRFDGISGHASPSASAEYLERYSVARPVDIKSSLTTAVHTDLISSSQRGGVWSSPSLRRDGQQPRASGHGSSMSTVREGSVSSSVARTGEHRMPGASGEVHGMAEASASPGRSTFGEEAGSARRTRPLGMTFQDQLKRVFGFS
ncbi:hypothetical protein N0V93_004648 [Gnomoniopsis smithogilvyi]|uniref:Uncharacterized protein n=1 Tax=Gnomoniopsis smithogilvyi TaxID=1191159 RepID=A0A9W8YT10_9PEZI|nr:hypothetical protein N0V93_004648 [Gnomoniopsis smithogilvyi]